MRAVVFHRRGTGVAHHGDPAVAQARRENGPAAAVDIAAQREGAVVNHCGEGAFFGRSQGSFEAEYTAAEDDHALAGSHGVAQLRGISEVAEGRHP